MLIPRNANTPFEKGLQENMQLAELSFAYLEALQQSETNQEVANRLGEWISSGDTLLPFQRSGSGKLNPEGETIKFDIKGPNGRGVVKVLAVCNAKETYRAAKITVTFDDGTVIDVPPPLSTRAEAP
jgi:hypothetical protein